MALKNTEKELFFLLLILLIAFVFRIYKLDLLPPGLYPDEAMNANNALESLETNDFKLFYRDNNGREGLFIWLIALSFFFLKASIFSFRIVPVIIGVLTVLGSYLFTKELVLLKKEEKEAVSIALLSSFFLAVSFWHVNFSRIAFRAILLPFVLVFSFYFLLKGFRNRKLINFAFSGIFYGIGLYTYTSFRMSLFLMAFAWLLFLMDYLKQKQMKDFLKSAACFALALIIATSPMLFYFLKNPQDFTGRASQVFVFSQDNPLKALLESFALHLAMFNFFGDGNWRHNIPRSPQLLWPMGIFFLFGFLITIKKLFSSLKTKVIKDIVYYSLPLAWFFIMLSPGFLTYEGIPHCLRSIGTITIAHTIAAITAWQTYLFLKKSTKARKLLITTCFIFLLMIMVMQFDKYFFTWGQNQETKNGFSYDYVRIGNLLNSFPSTTKKIVIVNMDGVPVPWPDGISVAAQSTMFIEITNNTKSTYISKKDMQSIKIEDETIIIPLVFEKEVFLRLKEMFPKGQIKIKDSLLFYQVNQ